ncbi:HdeD family acid-resistance protein [Paraburkholderia sp. DHOC27]|uniref:HdeD family acid-resistance protein n=1 Tax=Paraburkholderia sp. DHOC27 TaxID=2303330 RepID=UPI000E3B6D92|nr:DUF308 domain-containing protein [Paraburkholderia sp. DHOC27]RFU46221.1 DUF308 domain-containing protein [Paraburkholderia sp. DHOC27]
MVRLVMILLGVDYLRTRWRALAALGGISGALGIVVFIDALDSALYFPITPFATLLLLEGMATLAVAWTGMGGQRTLRYVKGSAFCFGAGLILIGHEHGNFVLSMIFGTLFLADGFLQIVSARVVRYRTWRLAVIGGAVEIALAIFFYQPYPTHYVGTVPYCLGLGLIFGGWNMILLASRVRRLSINPAVVSAERAAQAASATSPQQQAAPTIVEWDGPPGADEPALTIHVWTPVGTSKGEARRQPIIDRYIAAVDRNGVISTGHAALESPEGVYISLYPAVEIDRSPDEFTRLLRATRENDVPGLFQPDYLTESTAWCASTIQVRIRNYDPERLRRFWETYRRDTTYNLTYRNCSSTVSRALEAAIEGASARVWSGYKGWKPFLHLIATPELWVAAQVRKRAATMAWTPGLTLDYARALSMLADPRPSGWVKMARLALGKMYRSRRRWAEEARTAPQATPK